MRKDSFWASKLVETFEGVRKRSSSLPMSLLDIQSWVISASELALYIENGVIFNAVSESKLQESRI